MPGAVTTSAMIGSNYGYSLIWLILPIIFLGITFMMVTNRLAIITACILGMILSFYATLIGIGGPDFAAFGKGLVSFEVPQGSLATALAFISTNAAKSLHLEHRFRLYGIH